MLSHTYTQMYRHAQTKLTQTHTQFTHSHIQKYELTLYTHSERLAHIGKHTQIDESLT